MKEAFGGIFTIAFIVVFLVIVIGILGFVVSYTKAFRMKSDIIYTIERYEGSCCGGGSETSLFSAYSSKSCSPQKSMCRQKVAEKARDLGYNPVSLNCPSGYAKATYDGKELFCYKINNVVSSGNKRITYSVITQVDINFPIVENMLGLHIFQVSGDTREIQLQN